ncbi:MAG: DUF4870 domain-containing protein [Cyanobacteria bacterium P01_G01_bin.54]
MSNPDHNSEFRQWAIFLHLSQLSGIVIPFGGIIVPIVIWQMKKEEFPLLDQHGKMVVNWLISSALYSVIGGLLMFIAILSAIYEVIGLVVVFAPIAGLVLATVVGCSFVFPIIGSFKANGGKLWKYPLTLEILK